MCVCEGGGGLLNGGSTAEIRQRRMMQICSGLTGITTSQICVLMLTLIINIIIKRMMVLKWHH